MTARLEQIGTNGSPDGLGRAGAPSVREPWAVGLSPGRGDDRRPAQDRHAGAGASKRVPAPAPRRPGRMSQVRILLWHGYLLGGTGSNVYTRQLAREWSRAGHDVTVLSQEPRPEAYDLGGAAVVRPDVHRLPPGLRPRPLRGLRGASRPGLHARGARRLGRRERGRRPRAAPGRPRLHEPRAARRARRRGHRGAVRRQGARLGARVLDERQPGARALGPRVARGGRGDVRRLGAHPHGARGGLRDGGAGARGAAGRRRRAVDAGGARRRARRARARGSARRPEPRQPGRAPPRRRERRAAGDVPRGRCAADRRLLRQAHRAEGRRRPA